MSELDLQDGKSEQARADLEESLAIYRSAEDKSGLAQVSNHLGDVLCYSGDLEKAASFYKEGISICQDLENREGTMGALCDLGYIDLMEHDIVQARWFFNNSLAIFCQWTMDITA